MLKKLSSVLLAGSLLMSAFAVHAVEKSPETATAAPESPIVQMNTTLGSIYVELNPEKAPITVKNFLRYVNEGFYNNTMFHRIIDRFMIQSGGFDEKYHKKETHEPIKIESDNGLKNIRGTIAMARTSVVDSATSQWFINVKDNAMLDFTKPTQRGYGYAVFGKVVDGMDVVDKIKKSKTRRFSTFRNAPTEDILVIDMKVLEGDALKSFKAKSEKTH